MKRFLLILCIVLVLVSMLISSSSIKTLQKETQALQQDLKVLEEEFSNNEEEFKKEIEIRNALDKKGFEIINAMKNKNTEFLKTQLSKDTICLEDRIRDNTGWEYVFPLKKEELGRRQAYWINQGEEFIMGYYIESVSPEGHSSLIIQEEFYYRIEDNEWKLYTILTQ